MGLNENYLTCIFMNINKMSKIEENEGKAMALARVWMGYKMIYLASLKPIFMAASVVRGTPLMP